MTTTQVTVAVIVVLLVLALLGVLVALRGRRRREERRTQAGELRGDVAAGMAGVHAQQQRADELEREATKARERADLLEDRAVEQRRSAEQSEAEHEDAVRRADALDPDVDHRAADYVPDLETPRAMSDAAAQADREVGGDGTAAAGPETGPQTGPETGHDAVRRPTDPHDPDFDAGPGTDPPRV